MISPLLDNGNRRICIYNPLAYISFLANEEIRRGNRHRHYNNRRQLPLYAQHRDNLQNICYIVLRSALSNFRYMLHSTNRTIKIEVDKL